MPDWLLISRIIVAVLVFADKGMDLWLFTMGYWRERGKRKLAVIKTIIGLACWMLVNFR